METKRTAPNPCDSPNNGSAINFCTQSINSIPSVNLPKKKLNAAIVYKAAVAGIIAAKALLTAGGTCSGILIVTLANINLA